MVKSKKMIMQKKKILRPDKGLFLLDNTHCVWEVSELHPGGVQHHGRERQGTARPRSVGKSGCGHELGASSSAREQPHSPSSWGQMLGGAMGRGGEAKAPLLARSISVTIRCDGWPGCPGWRGDGAGAVA